jgi:hypothetical protein
MKKYLFVLASLSIVFGAQAAEEQAAPGAKVAQERAAKHASCRKEAIEKGLKDQDQKVAIAACIKPK